MQRVAIVNCDDYESKQVRQALDKALELIGGLEYYIKPGMKVLLKCNLLMKKKPEEHTTTHPMIVEAMVKAVQQIGATPIIGDSPAGLYNERTLRGVYRVCGMEEIAERCGAELNYGTDVVEVHHPDGKLIKGLTVVKLLEEVDAVISMAKLKTHGMTTYTGAVKNLFGVVPGSTKAEYHLRMKKLDDFSDMLVDICSYVKPILSIMDAIVGMEGNGPSAGDPRKIGAILASSSPYALDVASASLVGISPESVPTIRKAEERGLCSARLDEIKLLGDSFEALLIKDFKIPEHGRVNFFERYLRGDNPLAQFLNHHIGPRPVFNFETCVGCGDCKEACPPEAIKMADRKPRINLKACIRCYCCQELCPKKAVNIRRSWIFRTFK